MTEVVEILSDSEPEPNLQAANRDIRSPLPVIDVSSDAPEEHAPLSLDQMMKQVLEMVPDVALDHLEDLMGAALERGDSSQCVERVINALFEASSYPKDEPTQGRKRKRENSNDEEGPAIKVVHLETDYASKERAFRGGPNYIPLASSQLSTDFPFIPSAHIKTTFRNNGYLYAPTHLQLLAEQSSSKPPFKLKATRTKVSGKSAANDEEFLAEREWLERHLEEAAKDPSALPPDQEEEGDIECGCCFTSYSFQNMIQCAEGHLFCRTCIVQYAENLLGSQNCAIICIDQSNCKEPFPEVELERVLSPKLLELYHRIKQRKEIAAAGLEGLEECPFCDFKLVIENPEEKLFRCQTDDCRAITCRSCKKPDHLPKSCKEMDEDTALSGRHAVEEALSKALMRSCPKCKQSIIKDYGCNKMTCSQCHTLFCYICQVAITDYNHFDKQGGPSRGQADGQSKRCPLYDGSSRIKDEMEVAAKEAAQKFQSENPDVKEKDLKVEVPKVANTTTPRVAHPYQPYIPLLMGQPVRQPMHNPNQFAFGAGVYGYEPFLPRPQPQPHAHMGLVHAPMAPPPQIAQVVPPPALALPPHRPPVARRVRAYPQARRR